MLSNALRTVRPATLARLTKPTVTSAAPLRALSSSAIRRSEGPPPPKLFGPGTEPGKVPTDYDQATGLERLQLLGEMEGVAVFDKNPLDSSRIGTLSDPIMVPSYDTMRLVGCTGSPADSHEVLWFSVRREKVSRCIECGSVYALDFQGIEDHGHEDHGHADHGHEHAPAHH